jgi:hypothetical protein
MSDQQTILQTGAPKQNGHTSIQESNMDNTQEPTTDRTYAEAASTSTSTKKTRSTRAEPADPWADYDQEQDIEPISEQDTASTSKPVFQSVGNAKKELEHMQSALSTDLPETFHQNENSTPSTSTHTTSKSKKPKNKSSKTDQKATAESDDDGDWNVVADKSKQKKAKKAEKQLELDQELSHQDIVVQHFTRMAENNFKTETFQQRVIEDTQKSRILQIEMEKYRKLDEIHKELLSLNRFPKRDSSDRQALFMNFAKFQMEMWTIYSKPETAEFNSVEKAKELRGKCSAFLIEICSNEEVMRDWISMFHSNGLEIAAPLYIGTLTKSYFSDQETSLNRDIQKNEDHIRRLENELRLAREKSDSLKRSLDSLKSENMDSILATNKMATVLESFSTQIAFATIQHAFKMPGISSKIPPVISSLISEKEALKEKIDTLTRDLEESKVQTQKTKVYRPKIQTGNTDSSLYGSILNQRYMELHEQDDTCSFPLHEYFDKKSVNIVTVYKKDQNIIHSRLFGLAVLLKRFNASDKLASYYKTIETMEETYGYSDEHSLNTISVINIDGFESIIPWFEGWTYSIDRSLETDGIINVIMICTSDRTYRYVHEITIYVKDYSDWEKPNLWSYDCRHFVAEFKDDKLRYEKDKPSSYNLATIKMTKLLFVTNFNTLWANALEIYKTAYKKKLEGSRDADE